MKRANIVQIACWLLYPAMLSCTTGKYAPGPQPDMSGYYRGTATEASGLTTYIAVLNKPDGQAIYYDLGATDGDTTVSGVFRYDGSWLLTGYEYEAAFTGWDQAIGLSATLEAPYTVIEGNRRIEQASDVYKSRFKLSKQ